MAEDPQTLFAELDDFIQAESHEEALEVCERILALAADDGDAFHCKLISLIELGRYAEAVQAVEAHGELAAGREFEHAYCLYQLNREPEALALLDQAGLDVARNAQLAAQIRFRLGEYARAAELFQVAEGEEGGSAESSVNTLAALVSAGQTDAALAYAEQAGSSDDGAQFELLYNLACAHIEKGELGRAQLLLQRALETCRESLTAEEYSEEEIEAGRRRRPPAPARGVPYFCVHKTFFLLHDDPCAELLVRLDETIPAPPLYGSDPRSPTPHSPLPALPSPHSPRLLSPIPTDSHGRPSLCVAPVFPNVCAVSTV